MEFCTSRPLKLTLETLWGELQVNKWDYSLWIPKGFTGIQNDYWSKCPMFLHWLNLWFVYFDHSWDKISWNKCFILACKRSTNQTWHFFQITFQSDSCFSPFWTDPWKQKVKNILHFHCANWNKPKSEPLQLGRDHPERFLRAPVCRKIFSFLSIPCVITRQWQTQIKKSKSSTFCWRAAWVI